MEGHLDADIDILKCIYPELIIIASTNELVEGKLQFTFSTSKNIRVFWRTNGQDEEISMQNFANNTFKFKFKHSSYAGLARSLDFSVESKWMTNTEIDIITNSIHQKFDHESDSSSESFDPTFLNLMMMLDFLINDCINIIFPDAEYKCTSLSQFQFLKRSYENLMKTQFESTKFDCCICIDTKKGFEMVQMPCKLHHLCYECITSYYSTLIEEGRISNVRCPECPFKESDLNSYDSYKSLKEALLTPCIPFEFFEGILPKQTSAKYKRLFYEQSFSKLSQHSPYSCVTCPRCEKWCLKEDLDDQMLLCPTCDFCFCFSCLHSWHGSSNQCGNRVAVNRDYVEEYISDDTSERRKRELEVKYGKKTMKIEADQLLADKLLDLAIEDKDANLKRCPGCRTVIQRSEGCNRMKCAVCSMLFCYLCGIQLYHGDPYAHFREPFSECCGLLFEGMPGAEPPLPGMMP